MNILVKKQNYVIINLTTEYWVLRSSLSVGKMFKAERSFRTGRMTMLPCRNTEDNH